jgi:hypothetical protein
MGPVGVKRRWSTRQRQDRAPDHFRHADFSGGIVEYRADTCVIGLEFVSGVDGYSKQTAGKSPYFRRLVVMPRDVAGSASFTSRNPRWFVPVLGSPFPRPPGM